MSRAEEIKHLLEKSRQMSVDETYPITEGEVVEFISSSFEFGFVCGALSQKQQDQARSAAEIAREEMIEKAIGWIGEIYNYHEIMRYSDCCEPSLSELIEWFKNYIKKGKENEVQERKSK